jgi:hypothetical protein
LVTETEKFVKTFSWFPENSTLYYKANSMDGNQSSACVCSDNTTS